MANDDLIFLGNAQKIQSSNFWSFNLEIETWQLNCLKISSKDHNVLGNKFLFSINGHYQSNN
jgi:hypothetical protein